MLPSRHSGGHSTVDPQRAQHGGCGSQRFGWRLATATSGLARGAHGNSGVSWGSGSCDITQKCLGEGGNEDFIIKIIGWAQNMWRFCEHFMCFPKMPKELVDLWIRTASEFHKQHVKHHEWTWVVWSWCLFQGVYGLDLHLPDMQYVCLLSLFLGWSWLKKHRVFSLEDPCNAYNYACIWLELSVYSLVVMGFWLYDPRTMNPMSVVNHHALFWLFQDSGSMKICSESECPICLEMLPAGANPEKVIPLPCGHSFHSSCASGKPRAWTWTSDPSWRTCDRNILRYDVSTTYCKYMQILNNIIDK